MAESTDLNEPAATHLVVLLPERDTDEVSDQLRALTENLSHIDPDGLCSGLLGGAFGYGVEYSTPVFEMHPYYGGDCTCGFDARQAAWARKHAHAGHCYQTAYAVLSKAHPDRYGAGADACKSAEKRLCEQFNIPYNGGRGCARHCTCGHDARYEHWALDNAHHMRCPLELPNFKHHRSGVTVSWYKYIGRDMQVQAPVDFDWAACIKECGVSASNAQALKRFQT
jgi:hypothetical protein